MPCQYGITNLDDVRETEARAALNYEANCILSNRSCWIHLRRLQGSALRERWEKHFKLQFSTKS